MQEQHGCSFVGEQKKKRKISKSQTANTSSCVQTLQILEYLSSLQKEKTQFLTLNICGVHVNIHMAAEKWEKSLYTIYKH